MKTHKIRLLWAIQSICITVWYSLLVIYHSYFHKREKIDQDTRGWASAMMKVIRLSCKVYNPHNVTFSSDHPYILMSNHSSLYDIPIIFMSIPASVRMVAKKELMRIPIWRTALKASEMPIIDRKNPAQAIKDLEGVKKLMQSGIIPWIAPEGTRSRHGKLNVFKKGGFMLALQTGATIVPIGIRGASNILPADSFNVKMDQMVEVHIAKPIEASCYSVAQRKELISTVRASIQEAAQVASV